VGRVGSTVTSRQSSTSSVSFGSLEAITSASRRGSSVSSVVQLPGAAPRTPAGRPLGVVVSAAAVAT
jgi:hypothetical protein